MNLFQKFSAVICVVVVIAISMGKSGDYKYTAVIKSAGRLHYIEVSKSYLDTLEFKNKVGVLYHNGYKITDDPSANRAELVATYKELPSGVVYGNGYKLLFIGIAVVFFLLVIMAGGTQPSEYDNYYY